MEIAVTFGRFNPPHIGHQLIFNKLLEHENHMVFCSKTVDKKNPLDAEYKSNLISDVYGVRTEIQKDIFSSLSTLDKYNKVILYFGSDRIEELESRVRKYNGVQGAHGLFTFEEIEVVEVGKRDGQTLVGNMSSSKLRNAVATDDEQTFKSGMPNGFDWHPLWIKLKKAIENNDVLH